MFMFMAYSLNFFFKLWKLTCRSYTLAMRYAVVEGSELILTIWGSLTSAETSIHGRFRFSPQQERNNAFGLRRRMLVYARLRRAPPIRECVANFVCMWLGLNRPMCSLKSSMTCSAPHSKVRG